MHTPLRKTTDAALIALFLLAICMPVGIKWIGCAPVPSTGERRKPAVMPTFSFQPAALAEFPHQFDTYFNDSFAFRSWLIRGHSLVKVMGLGESPLDKVLIGRQGWLFLNRDPAGDDAIADARGTRPLTEPQLDALVHYFVQRRDWLAGLGIRYVIWVPPNKETAYPEFLPAGREPVGAASPLNQLKARFKDMKGLDLIDNRSALQAEKQQCRVYLKNDTHWNRLGAYVGYRDLAECLHTMFPQIEPVPRESITFATEPHEGDLARMMGLGDVLLDEEVTETFRSPLRGHVLGEVVLRPVRRINTVVDGASSLPRAVILHDSFVLRCEQLLMQHFSRATFVATHELDVDLIERETPNVVIDEIVERMLRTIVTKSVAPIPMDARGRFLASRNVFLKIDGGRAEPFHDLEPIKMNPDGSRLFKVTGDDPQLILPKIEVPAKCVVRVDVDSPGDSTLQVFWTTPDSPNYTEICSEVRRLPRGRAVVWVLLPMPFSGPLRIDPGSCRGNLTVYSIEVRGVGN